MFREQYRDNGSIQAYNARLAAKEYTRKEAIDYFDMYALVARITSVWLLFALASTYKLHVHQMDVKTIFLNSDLIEKVYID